MEAKKYLVAIIAIALLLAIPGLVGAQHSDFISDSEDDVFYWEETENGFRWKENVEHEDIDIISSSIEEIDGNISVELEVQGIIQSQDQSQSNVWYSISLEDGEGESYSISYQFGDLYINWPGGQEYGFTEPSGFGTSTFEVSFSLDDFGNPDSLQIMSVETYEYLEAEGTGEYYTDSAGPEADEPDTSDSGGEVDPEGFLDDLFARGMMCLAIAIIIPIIVLAIIVVVVIKLLSSEDEGSQQPPQQGPPPSQQQQPAQQQQQQQPSSPPEDQGGSGETPPPPPEDE
ncbi:MAG: hypothetical protein V5A88_08665 [Candidatus Thermoplasmatota archaeon]